jgi:hypothetical protein
MSTDDEVTWIVEGQDRDGFQAARFRRAAADAAAVFNALASLQSLTALRNAVMALDETSAKRALIVGALEHRSRELSADEQVDWMRSDGQLSLDFFELS